MTTFGFTVSTLARELALAEAVDRWVQRGWYVARQDEDVVEMRKPKRPLSPLVALGALALGLKLPGNTLVYGMAFLAVYALIPERAVYITVGHRRECPGRTVPLIMGRMAFRAAPRPLRRRATALSRGCAREVRA